MNGSIAMKIWSMLSLDSTEEFTRDLESILKLPNEKLLKKLIEVSVVMVVEFYSAACEIQF